MTWFPIMAKKSRTRSTLTHVEAVDLKIKRKPHGDNFIYLMPRGGMVRDKRTLYRLKRLAVPPAYQNVRFAQNPRAHIQAIGRDAAGRRQYRYHPQWDEVREHRKARHLAALRGFCPSCAPGFPVTLAARI